MQSSEQINNIVQDKIRRTSNKKTLVLMKSAIDDIEKGHRIDIIYSLIGLLIILPTLYYLISLFF